MTLDEAIEHHLAALSAAPPPPPTVDQVRDVRALLGLANRRAAA